MDNSESYRKSLDSLKATAKKIEEQYVEPEDRSLEPQKNSVLYSKRSPGQWFCGKCPRCEGSELVKDRHCKGVRMNGDSYGSFSQLCRTCGFYALFDYDDYD